MNNQNSSKIRGTMNNATTNFSRYTIILCLGIFVALTVIYIGMAHQMQLERQSVTGLLYAQDPVAAKEYADIIMVDRVNNRNAADGVGAMVKLGYADTAFINNANRYPINWMIASAMIGSFLIFAGLFVRDRAMKRYITEFTDFKNRYNTIQKRLDGMNTCLTQKNNQIRVFIENVAHQIRTPISYVYLTLDETFEKCEKLLELIDSAKRNNNAIGNDNAVANDNSATNDNSAANELREIIIDQNNKVKECIKCIDRIKELLSRLLKISRLESGKVIMETQECDIVAFISDICGEYSDSDIHLQIHTVGIASGVDLVNDADMVNSVNGADMINSVNGADMVSSVNGADMINSVDGVNGVNSVDGVENLVYIDTEWFREAIVNILNNALEHSDQFVPVDVEVTIDTYKVNISITNCGDDIAESDIPYIFDRFYTAENVLYSHTGIGLNLANLIISQHSGNIKLTSQNRYTQFLIIMPKYKFTSKYKPAV